VLAVGSVDENENYSSFSSTGPSSDGRVKPNVAAMGEGTTTITTSGGTQTGSGTSFAAPLIAGLAACLWQAHPNAGSMEVFNAIQQSASQYSNPDDLLGYGIPNFMAAHYILAGIPVTNDEDGDGVPDVDDECLLTPFSAVVDIDGCPVEFELNSFLQGLENPFGSSSSYLYYAASDAQLEIAFFDVSGKKVAEREVALVSGAYNRISLVGLQDLAQGMYVVKVSSAGQPESRRLVKY
jgi:hypothetical protein